MIAHQLPLPLPDLGNVSVVGRGLDAEQIVALGEAVVAQAVARGDTRACDIGWALQAFAREAGEALEHADEKEAEIEALKDELGEARGEVTSEAIDVAQLLAAMTKYEADQREAAGKRKGRVDHPVAVPWSVLASLLDSIRASAADEGVRSIVDKLESLLDQAYESDERREKELALARCSDRELLARVPGSAVCDYASRNGWTRVMSRNRSATTFVLHPDDEAQRESIMILRNPIESPGESFAAMSELARRSGTTLRALLVDLVLAQR